MFYRYKVCSLMKILSLSHLLSYLLLNIQIIAQSFPVSNYTLENGLNTNFIHDVTQDKLGRMWFATEVGMSVYDGHSWTNYSEKDGLPRTEYLQIKVDSANNIVAMPNYCSENVAIFSNNKWQLLDPIPVDLGSFSTFASFDFIYKNNKLVLYFASAKGVLYYEDNKWGLISELDGLISNQVNFIKCYQNKIYVSTQSGLSIIQDGKIDNSLNSILRAPSKKIKAMEFEFVRENSVPIIWLLGEEWIGTIQNGKFELQAANNRMSKFTSKQRIRHTIITYDGKDRIYYGSEIERFYLEKSTKKITFIGQENGFTTSGSSAIFLDRESNLWFASYRGIDKVSNMSFQNYFQVNGLLENEVASILEVLPGYLIFGHNNGLTLLKDGKFRTFKIANKSNGYFLESRVLDLCKDSLGTVWIAGPELGLGKLINENEIKWIGDKNKIIHIYSVQTDPAGTIWVATDSGLYKVSPDQTKLIMVENKIFKNLVRRLYCNERGVIYGAKASGLAIFKNGAAKEISNSRLIWGNNLYAVHDYKNDTKLLGTADGLYLLENESIRKFNENNFSIDKKVFFITRDKQNNFWFGTNDGIVRWDGTNARRFSVEDGLSGGETNRAAYTVDSFGNLWIGTDRGLSCYTPQYDTPVMPPVLSSLQIEDLKGTLHDLDKSFDTSNGENSFIFRFKPISFINEKHITFRVKLEGFETEWMDIGTNNQIRYTNLKPGEYKFLLQTKNIGSDWSKTYSTSNIILHRPFYYQWWFISLVLIISASIFYTSYNYMTQLKFNARLTAEVKQRTKALEESENKLRTIIQNAPNTISAINREGKFLYISQMWKAFNNSNTDHPVTIWDYIPKEKVEYINKILAEVFDNRKTVNYEINYVDNNNIEHWLDNSISPILNEDAVPEAIIISNDVTERKLNEMARREIEERQDAVLKALPLVFYNSNFESNFAATWITSNVYSCTGFEIDSFLTVENFWNTRIHPEDREFVLRKYEDLLLDKPIRIEYRWLCANGIYKWFLEYSVPKGVDESGKKEFLGIWLDITENKQMQQRLERLNECFLNFGIDPMENIQRLITLCGTEMGSSFALYNYLKNNLIQNILSWNMNEKIAPFSQEGRLCNEVFKANNRKLIVIEDVNNTHYFDTDPAVTQLKIKTYVGTPIIFDDKTTGSLCLIYQHRKQISDSDRRFISIIGSAIAVEEERRRSEELIQNSLKEKEILLKEIHHRVKNNLQVISSLLYLQSEDIEDEKILSMFKDSTNRVRSMALVHEKLYQSKDLAHINLDDYINNLVTYQYNAFSPKFNIIRKIEVEEILLSIDLAMPCGLIINELLTNSLKYAFPNQTTYNPEILISVKQIEEQIIIVVSDNGIGLPKDFNIEDEQKTLGLKLVKMLTNQLDGMIKVDRHNGTNFQITFNKTFDS
ncbi:hypothetical protein C0389_00215 [bacterium]|nr:hypothetical protein [bacterium]